MRGNWQNWHGQPKCRPRRSSSQYRQRTKKYETALQACSDKITARSCEGLSGAPAQAREDSSVHDGNYFPLGMCVLSDSLKLYSIAVHNWAKHWHNTDRHVYCLQSIADALRRIECIRFSPLLSPLLSPSTAMQWGLLRNISIVLQCGLLRNIPHLYEVGIFS